MPHSCSCRGRVEEVLCCRSDQSIGIVKAIHFDEEVNTPEQLSHLLDDLKQIPRNTTTTVFLFVSPQELSKHKDLRRTLLACNHRNVLRMILIDQFHMHCQHGMDLCHEIRTVFDEFIRPLMKRKTSPYMIACTATCSPNNIKAFEEMSGVTLARENRVWSPASSFRQRHINMTMEVSSVFTTSTSGRILKFVKNNDEAAFAVFSNTAAMASKLYSHTEDILNGARSLTDIVLVHGSLSPHEKFYLTNAFCKISTSTTTKYNVRGLFGTSASDTGLDHPHLLMLVLSQLPRDMHSLIQRRGRAGSHCETSECHLIVSFDDYSFTALQIESGIHRNSDNVIRFHSSAFCIGSNSDS